MEELGIFGGADYDGERIFCIHEPCDVILTQWGKIYYSCLLKLHVKDTLVYATAAIYPVCQNMRL